MRQRPADRRRRMRACSEPILSWLASPPPSSRIP